MECLELGISMRILIEKVLRIDLNPFCMFVYHLHYAFKSSQHFW